MNSYVIFTDSACDINAEILKSWGVRYTSLTFRFDGSEKEYANDEMEAKDFYDRMRAGGIAKTAAINVDGFAQAFEKILQEGKDVLYLGFSSGLSTTYNSARLAVEGLRERYPDRKLMAVDTLAASAGMGLLVYLASQKQQSGASMEEVVHYVNALIPKICHWFTVDDLVYLKRGGRVSAAAAFVGGVLGIKPVMHVDNEGHLVPVAKVRGRRTSIAAMAQKYGELAETPGKGTIFISHGDCMGDVELLAGMLKEQYGAEIQIITDVGPVIGAHSGPGTLALFFIGKEK